MGVVTVGDSHSKFGWEHVMVDGKPLTIYWLGPWLMHRVGRDGFQVELLRFEKDDTVIFSFGEIDCRCQVHKHISSERSWKQIIDDLVTRYINRLIEVQQYWTSIQIVVYGVPPPVHHNEVHNNHEYPFLGTDEERKSFVMYMNRQLRKQCQRNGFMFIDVYTQYADSNGFLRRDLSDGSVHIANPIYLQQWCDFHLTGNANTLHISVM